MDAREKAIAGIVSVLGFEIDESDAYSIMDLPELEAYFREKFENEPGRLAVEKECKRCAGTGKVTDDFKLGDFTCRHCGGGGILKRRMTRKEVEEWAINIVEDVTDRNSIDYNPGLLVLSSGERLSVE